MTLEQVFAILDAIALEGATVEPCAVCRRTYFQHELSESCGARVCAKCDPRGGSSVRTANPSHTQAA